MFDAIHEAGIDNGDQLFSEDAIFLSVYSRAFLIYFDSKRIPC